MSLTRNAGAAVAHAANSRWLELLTRAGFVGYGILHLLFAWLALQIAFGRSGEEGNQNGALRTLGAQPLGKFLLVAIAIGLFAMATWQAFEATIGHRGRRGRERLFERVASVLRTVVFVWLAWTAVKVFEDASANAADQQQALTAKLMAGAGGRWLVGLAGLALAAVGIGMIGYGLKKKFERNLKIGQMTPKARIVARRLGMAGYAARGAVFAIAGLLIVVAAMKYDPAKARGLDAALRTLRDQSYGPVLLALAALGIAGFGIYCFLQSRYRRV
ncbi:DUF1206 domain-containing protein [Micromonospora sp. DR5-3]|uniref:DUF1206 domain-containing protein n=1 Tax=unclassified Micromonospora TaxID=2617518 RepID=UPI0011DB5373|nr:MULTISPECIES: DUF1206 domain-containing protein [unclassified Micromonospora]MCW3817494.1 DUF1206 domain-containing protein [Micromonospora sp. DR5-3]TYC25209.1 DUF1206 domain-containing protein [Micromonospora sp. MP36]